MTTMTMTMTKTKELTLVIVDTAQIQPYVFGSNRLRENIAASYLVAQATGDWALDAAMKSVGQRHNVNARDGIFTLTESWHIEDQDLSQACCEVIYAGGGNVLALFSNPNTASAFSKRLSQTALERSPGLRLVFVHQTVQWDADSCALPKAVLAAFASLAKVKHERPANLPPLGLGVTVMCGGTGMPASGLTPPIKNEETGEDDPTSVYPASSQILAKREVDKEARESLDEAFKREMQHVNSAIKLRFPYDLDNLGRSDNESSHIAIVHIDGNGMGKRVEALARGSASSRGYIQNIRRLSDRLRWLAQQSMSETLTHLVKAVTAVSVDENTKAPALVYRLRANKKLHELQRIVFQPSHMGGHYLPFRPIVYGGDDLTFVCDGRLALALADEMLTNYEDAALSLFQPDAPVDAEVVRILREAQPKPLDRGFTACAGVAIVKTHYPFARAYALSETLCSSAKKFAAQHDVQGACLDWHWALSGLSGELEEIRQREYQASFDVPLPPDKTMRPKLQLRPVSLNGSTAHSWRTIERAIGQFRGSDWLNRRNKVKALRDALREGPNAVNTFLTKFNAGKGLPDLNIADRADWQTRGWHVAGTDIECGYFDAIELLDLHLPLDLAGDLPPDVTEKQEAAHAV